MDAAAVRTDLEHVQTFLIAQSAVLGPSAAQVINGQHCSFMNRLGRLVSLPADLASQLTSTVQSGPWNEDQKVQLCSAIASKLTTHSNGRATGTNIRRSNQEIRTFYHYLSVEDKSVIDDPAATTSTKVGVACQRSLTIGLDIPSESSMKHIVAVVCGLGVKNFEADHEGLYGLVAEYKRWMKSFRSKGLTPPNCEFVSHYPASPKDLPSSIYTHAYKSAVPWTCCDAMIAEINVIESRVPLRKSSKLVKPSPVVIQNQSMQFAPPWMQALSQMFGGYPNHQNQPPLNIQYLSPSSTSATAALALPGPPAIPTQPVAPAIIAPPADAVHQPVSQTASPTLALQDIPPVGVKDQIEAFMDAHNERKDARDERKNELDAKTPVKKGRKPNDKSTEKKPIKPSTKVNTPQAANKKVAHKSWHSTVQKAVGKQAWLKAASGCGKCRYKPFCTPSCWRGRGVNV